MRGTKGVAVALREDSLLGDFNFTEHPSDSSPPSPSLTLDQTTCARWDKLMRRLRLREIAQPTPTTSSLTPLTPLALPASTAFMRHTHFCILTIFVSY